MLKKKLLCFWLVIMMIFSIFPVQAFAQEEGESPPSPTVSLEYELKQELSEDEKEVHITIVFSPMDEIVLQKVLLPDGKEQTGELDLIDYSVFENGLYSFTVSYLEQEEPKQEIIDVEVTTVKDEKASSKEETLTEEKASEYLPANVSPKGWDIVEIRSADEFRDAVKNYSATYGGSGSNSLHLRLMDHIELNEKISFDRGKINVLGNGYSITFGSEGAFHVNGDLAELRLGKNGSTDTLTITGKANITRSSPPILVNDGKLIMYAGVSINNFTQGPYNGNFGSVIVVTGSGSTFDPPTFEMYGGTIENNNNYCETGMGAVVAMTDAVFKMFNGNIINNKTISNFPVSGGVTIAADSIFTMKGGRIEGNSVELKEGKIQTQQEINNGALGTGGLAITDIKIDPIFFQLDVEPWEDDEEEIVMDFKNQVNSNPRVSLSGGSITLNHGLHGGGISLHRNATLTPEIKTIVSNNTAKISGSDFFIGNGQSMFVPAVPNGKLQDKQINGWFLDNENDMWKDNNPSQKLTVGSQVEGPKGIIAAFEKSSGDTYNLTYDINGGTGNVPAMTKHLKGAVVTLNTTTRPTHDDDNGKKVVFAGWTEAQDTKIYAQGDTLPSRSLQVTMPEADKTVYAVYGYDINGDGQPDVDQDTYNLTYDINGGTGNVPAMTKHLKGAVVTLNTTTRPTHDDDNGKKVVFAGWTEAQDTKIYAQGDTLPSRSLQVTMPEADKSVYAVYGYDINGDGQPDVDQDTYLITFDANGGNAVTPSDMKTNIWGKLNALPTPTRSGNYRFDGWYTQKDSGNKIDTNTVFTANTTLYAHWA
ncbi:InlB B-repeat-containing protein, partial [Clostridium cadaveris]|uniref:InlB B-repeat-containing protein n=1 Tax=Clostridium cadaveris TaxID=1529 RepID=UPI0015B6757B|nr:InlB B-repeat-containing protein [Clostridium cadaveris]